MVDSITTTFGGGNSEKVYYIYGDTGNINRVESLQNGVRYYDNTYKYDDLGQLIRENNRSAGKTYVFTYDNAGNITSKKTYAYTTADTITTSLLDTVIYEYNDPSCGDLLTKYDGHSIAYDSCLNPVTYYAGGETYTMTWTRGRRLSSMSSGSQTLSFTYNDEGIRTSKTVNGTKHTYSLSGSQILSEEWYTGTTQHLILYVYDANGSPIGMRYRNSTYSGAWLDSYMFVKNLQGDIIYIYDEDGNRIVTYTYDAWGNILSVTGSAASTIGVMNPFRYRGYYYDEETSLYYIASRYYNPEIGRWINADSAIAGVGSSIHGYNLFAYCFNNPINMIDPTGNWPFFAITAAIGAVVGAVVGGVVATKNGGNVWAGIGIGAAAGALIGTGAGMAAGATLAGSITATTTQVAFGASTLATTVATGGLGAGATYIANNLSQAINNSAHTAQAAVSKMQQVAEKGKAGEIAANITKNHSHIDSLTGTAKYRIPDMPDHTAKILGEVKNYSGVISYTAQLKDFVLWSQLKGYQMHLYTNSTSFTGPLQQLIDSRVIQIFPIG